MLSNNSYKIELYQNVWINRMEREMIESLILSFTIYRKNVLHPKIYKAHTESLSFDCGCKRQKSMRFLDSLGFSVQSCWEALTVKQYILCTGHNNNVQNSIQRVINRLKTDKVNAKCSRLSSGSLYSWVRDQHEMQ